MKTYLAMSFAFVGMFRMESATSADDPTFQAAIAELRAGRYIVADKLFTDLLKVDTAVNPDIHYFAARAAFATNYYKRSKSLVETYLADRSESRLYQSEAESLKLSLDEAIAAITKSDKSAFAYAQQQATIFAYAAYRRNYPEGQSLDAADFLSFQRAKEVNVEIAYLRYLEFWPDGQFAVEAKRSADRSSFKEARRINTIESYQFYLADYPTGTFNEQAREREESLAFYKAQKGGSVESIKLFLSQYPSGRNRAEAERILTLALQNAPLRDHTGPTVTIPAGFFPYKKPGSINRPIIVEIPQPFVAMAHEVTFEQWDACVAEGACNGYSPSDLKWGRGKRPVINVNRADVDLFIGWFNGTWQNLGGDGLWRLPREIEWAYMARGARSGLIIQQPAPEQTGKSCRQCEDNQDQNATFPVGMFKQNNFGLFDMLGNVTEWVDECWHDDFSDTITGSQGDISDQTCDTSVVRGPLDLSTPVLFALQARRQVDMNERNSAVGFRLVRSQ